MSESNAFNTPWHANGKLLYTESNDFIGEMEHSDDARIVCEAMNCYADFDEALAALNRRIKQLVGIIRDLLPLADMCLLYQEAMKQAGAEQIGGIGAARDAIRQFIREAREIVEDEE